MKQCYGHILLTCMLQRSKGCKSSRSVQGKFKVKIGHLEPLQTLVVVGFVGCRFKVVQGKSKFFYILYISKNYMNYRNTKK